MSVSAAPDASETVEGGSSQVPPAADATVADAPPSGDSATSEEDADVVSADAVTEVTAEQAILDLAHALCNRIASCDPLSFVLTWGDASTCFDREELVVRATLGLPGNGATPSSLEQCAIAQSSGNCDDSFNGAYAKPCGWAGSLPTDASCVGNSQCVGGACYPNGTLCGVCGSFVGLASACSAGHACNPGLSCAIPTDASVGRCVTPVGEGAPCDHDHPCLLTLRCVQGACTRLRLGEGAPCGSQTALCDEAQNLVCGPFVPSFCNKVQLMAPGGACGTSVDGSAQCVAQGSCNDAGLCVAAAGDGQRCDPVQGPYCMFGAACINGICVPYGSYSCP